MNTKVSDCTEPKAYLNWVLFDEQFNSVQSSSGEQKIHPFTGFPINKKAYLFIYVSNQTKNQEVKLGRAKKELFSYYSH